ncbi:VanW family protein [Actinomadura yumaensis]|uniref:VanW family protein n=1 Tax=Actinomadura TaxID=1988 RepID=UPI00132C5D26|nr:VanW family protein [Actinomadura sp. J1-007]MWK34274.1 hypothetical protein [Actinomadura sp. J1-007]
MARARRARNVARAQRGRYRRWRGDQPGLPECAVRWWPFVAVSLLVTMVLLGAYLMVPRETGASAAERNRARAVAAPADRAAARVTPRMRAAGATREISSFTTRFTPGEPRVRNIEIAARVLDGLVVQPGRTFSFNRVVGPRTKRRGYVPAPTIVGSRLVNDLGGGICQVSTTLYNAVFEAGLQIRDARAHGLWMPEYPKGREAAVAYPSLDLTWRNDSGRPVAITSEFTGDSLTIRLWGTRRYDVRSRTSKPYGFTAFDSATDHGSKCVPSRGGRGFEIDVWRMLSSNGREVRREKFHTVYQSQTRLKCV